MKAVVFDFKDEELVGLVMDRVTAAKLLWLAGEVSASDKDTSAVFDGLSSIAEVEDIYDNTFMNNVEGRESSNTIVFPEVE